MYEELSTQDKERHNQEMLEYKERLAKARESAIHLVPSLYIHLQHF